MKKIEIEYKRVVDKYIFKFEKKHGYEFTYWVSNNVGEVACFIDQYFFNFDDIRYDINNKIPKGLIFKWQDYCVEKAFEKTTVNFKSYLQIYSESNV